MDTLQEQEADLKVYRNRKSMVPPLGMLFLLSLCLVLGDGWVIQSWIDDFTIAIIIPGLGLLVFTLLFIGVWGLVLRHLLRSSFWVEPHLTFSSQGLICRRGFGSGNILVPWEEIESISLGVLGSTFTLKNPFLAVTLKNAERFNALYGSKSHRSLKKDPTTGAHFTFYQMWGGASVSGILQQICDRYGKELREHDVQISR